MGGVSVFGQLRVSSAGKARGQMETQKCVRRNYRGHVAGQNNKWNKGDKGETSSIVYILDGVLHSAIKSHVTVESF